MALAFESDSFATIDVHYLILFFHSVMTTLSFILISKSLAFQNSECVSLIY